MTTKRRTRGILYEGITLDKSIERFFFTGEAERDTPAWELHLSRFFDEGKEIKRAWREHRKFLLTKWIQEKPGSRPWAWWQWDAPQTHVAGWDSDHFNSAQRRRLGGTGTPSHEVLSVWGGFSFGIPQGWINPEDVKTWPHLAGKEVDPNDPPVFESESAYLHRHNFLNGAEKIFLAKNPELFNPERIIFD